MGRWWWQAHSNPEPQNESCHLSDTGDARVVLLMVSSNSWTSPSKSGSSCSNVEYLSGWYLSCPRASIIYQSHSAETCISMSYHHWSSWLIYRHHCQSYGCFIVTCTKTSFVWSGKHRWRNSSESVTSWVWSHSSVILPSNCIMDQAFRQAGSWWSTCLN